MRKFWLSAFVLIAAFISFNPAHAASTCKKESGFWYVYCGDVKASDTPAMDAAGCFKSAKDICPTDTSKSTATCKKGKGDLWFVNCSGVQISEGGFGTAETCFAEAKSACP